MTLKKPKKLKVFLVFWINWWLKNCEKQKKLRSFLVFCMDCCYMSSKNLSKNQKRLEFFWFSALLQVRVPSKNQKNLEFFSFFKVMTKKIQKNSRKTKKNQTWASDQTFSEKVLVFWFFGFGLFPKEKSNSWLVPLNLEKTKKPKNQNFSENVWSEAHVWFFWFSSSFFGFFWS